MPSVDGPRLAADVTLSRPSGTGARLDFIDNIRWVMIVLVVAMHAAVTYSHLGSWYYMEDPKPGIPETVVFAYFQMGLQAFFMGLLFFVAAYFVPPAFARKGATRFIEDRFIRLIIPSLFYMLVIHPLIVCWLLRDHYHITESFPNRYLSDIRTLRFVGSSGPMWFAVALFGFSLVYLVAQKLTSAPVPKQTDGPLPTNRQVVGLILLMGACTFLARTIWPMGTNILNMQLCFFSQYILLFAAGLLAWKRNWLVRIDRQFAMRWFWAALSFGTLIWFAAMAAIVATHTEDKISGGFTWQSAAISFWEPFFCIGLCFGVLILFREHFNRKGSLSSWMTDNSFSVYLFHPPILIAVTLLLHSLLAPKLLKFLLATAAGTILTFALSHWIFRRIPLLKQVL